MALVQWGREIVANALISTLKCPKTCSKYAFVKIIAKMLKYAFWHILRHRHNPPEATADSSTPSD